jgi:hypothetical protein
VQTNRPDEAGPVMVPRGGIASPAASEIFRKRFDGKDSACCPGSALYWYYPNSPATGHDLDPWANLG